MSKNGPYPGPPWSHGDAEEPYAEPADPWGDQSAGVAEPSWRAHSPPVPQQPGAYPAPMPPGSGNPVWGPPAAPARRHTPVVALLVTLALIIVAGLVTTAWLLRDRDKPSAQQPAPSASAAAEPGPAPLGSEDARFYLKEGDCVVNEGSDTKPEMRTSPCASGTYKVLKQIKGKTTGEKDAEGKCATVPGYTKWYFYDSPLDDLDFVLCLKEHKAL